jgi:hypothetical protein
VQLWLLRDRGRGGQEKPPKGYAAQAFWHVIANLLGIKLLNIIAQSRYGNR